MASPADDEAIRSVLSAYEEAWNRHDSRSLLALLHEDFILWESGRRRIVYSRTQYAFWLRDIMRRHRYIEIVTPSIWVRNDSATVHSGMLVDGRSTNNIFHLIRENGGWFIIDSEF